MNNKEPDIKSGNHQEIKMSSIYEDSAADGSLQPVDWPVLISGIAIKYMYWNLLLMINTESKYSR